VGSSSGSLLHCSGKGTPVRKHSLRRALLGLTTAALLSAGLVASPAEAAPNARADAAADWLKSQLKDGLVISSYQSGDDWVKYTDYGLSLDFYFAFDGLGVRRAARTQIIQAIEPEAGSYVGTGDYAYAGALGKLLTAVQLEGLDPAAYSSRNLLAKLEGLVHTTADGQRGRAKDTWAAGDPFGGDYSNTIGQAWVVQALERADSARAPLTVSFLLKQQCADGFFRLYMESDNFSCDGGTADESAPSVDATAFAVQALLVAKANGATGLDDDIRDAARWLVARQADNGSFSDGGVRNANSTGVAAEALLALGRTGAAHDAAVWLRDHQVTGRIARRTELDGERGAVAYDTAAFREGKRDDITRATRYQWRRATAQAAVGLDAL
jgi:hypothetical protein